MRGALRPMDAAEYRHIDAAACAKQTRVVIRQAYFVVFEVASTRINRVPIAAGNQRSRLIDK
jgi:hypothetical protein